uniref:uncharacterized protein LOC118144399 n=1 Tax=Callithrix jacchus TaxID=9483 RepID=UPI0023DCF422|nr:uncharacterized protein LOC118144399 [Callithrix jacchus]
MVLGMLLGPPPPAPSVPSLCSWEWSRLDPVWSEPSLASPQRDARRVGSFPGEPRLGLWVPGWGRARRWEVSRAWGWGSSVSSPPSYHPWAPGLPSRPKLRVSGHHLDFCLCAPEPRPSACGRGNQCQVLEVLKRSHRCQRAPWESYPAVCASVSCSVEWESQRRRCPIRGHRCTCMTPGTAGLSPRLSRLKSPCTSLQQTLPLESRRDEGRGPQTLRAQQPGYPAELCQLPQTPLSILPPQASGGNGHHGNTADTWRVPCLPPESARPGFSTRTEQGNLSSQEASALIVMTTPEARGVSSLQEQEQKKCLVFINYRVCDIPLQLQQTD